MFEAFKQSTLAHCLRFAAVDPTYALWAAAEYERQMPWLLANLKRKVEQEIARAEHRSPVAAVDEPLLAQRAGPRRAGER